MKRKIYTLGIILFSLLGFGMNAYGQTPAAGDYVFNTTTGTDWNTAANWAISDGAGNLTAATAVPGSTNNVFIPAGYTISTTASQSGTASAWSQGATQIVLGSANTSIYAGMAVFGVGIPSGTYVTSVVSSTTFNLSAGTTNAPTGTTSLVFAPSCNNLYVAGNLTTSATLNCTDSLTLYGSASKITAASAAYLVCGGDIYVNSTDTLVMGANGNTSYVCCKNIFNKGVIKAYTAYSSMKSSLYVGFLGTTPGTGDYFIVNDGTFGTPTPSSTPVSGGGIRLLYSEQCSSLTIKHSSSSSAYAFNIGAILPNYNSSASTYGVLSSASNQTFNLNLNENMSLLWNGASIGLSLQNGNPTGALRTCTIAPGVTVYEGGAFHANRTTTTVAQGNFVYNVYGTLDMSTYVQSTAGYPSDFDLCMTTASGNTGSVTFNLGNGSNPASLVLGKSIRMIKQAAQSINCNFNTNSTVTFAKTAATAKNMGGTVYTLQNISSNNSYNPAVYLFPSNYYNLTINNDSTILPVAATYRGTYTATATGYAATSWKASTTYALPSSSSFTSPFTQGAVIFTGTYYYYVPIVTALGTYSAANPVALAGDTILSYIQDGQYVTGTGITSDAITGVSGANVTLTTAPSASATNGTLTFKGASGASAPVPANPSILNNHPYVPVIDGTQALIYLGMSLSPVQTTATGINLINSSNIKAYSTANQLIVTDPNMGDVISVYTVTGIKVASTIVAANQTTISLPTGIYLVQIGVYTTKVIIHG